MTTTPPRDWTAFRSAAVGKAEASRWIAVLPLAATEQHGPHLPFETDVLIGQAYLAQVRALVPDNLRVTFLPIEPVGISTEHIAYPGTQTLATDVALNKWMALCDAVAQTGATANERVWFAGRAGGPRPAGRVPSRVSRTRQGVRA